MFGILELVHLGIMVGDQVFNVPTLGTEEIERKPQVKVYATQVKQQKPMFMSHCIYDGVLVEYTRTWEEERNGTVWPAEPDKPAGYALILTKASCPDKEDEKERNVELFATGERGYSKKYVIRELERIVTWTLTPENHEKHTPKWLPQVVETIAMEAPSNPAAQSFLDEMSRRTGFTPIRPRAKPEPETEPTPEVIAEEVLPLNAVEPPASSPAQL